MKNNYNKRKMRKTRGKKEIEQLRKKTISSFLHRTSQFLSANFGTALCRGPHTKLCELLGKVT